MRGVSCYDKEERSVSEVEERERGRKKEEGEREGAIMRRRSRS